MSVLELYEFYIAFICFSFFLIVLYVSYLASAVLKFDDDIQNWEPVLAAG